MQKRKCIRLSVEEKIEILRYIESNPNLADKRIAEIFSTKFKKTISRRTINDIRRNKHVIVEMVLEGSIYSYRQPKFKYGEVDKELFKWVEKLESKGAIINDSLLLNKSHEIANTLKIPEFKGSLVG